MSSAAHFTPGVVRTLAALGALTRCAVAIVVAAVAFNFFEARQRPREVAVERRSAIATGTMALYFVSLWALLRSGAGAVRIVHPAAALLVASLGAALVAVGAWVNVAGRLRLGGGWANQIRLYADHVLVTDGVFAVVRHPLYGSLAWMALGASIQLTDPLAGASVLVVFVPMMVHRARLEERVLEARFPEYGAYRRRVGMLFPRLRRQRPAGPTP